MPAISESTHDYIHDYVQNHGSDNPRYWISINGDDHPRHVTTPHDGYILRLSDRIHATATDALNAAIAEYEASDAISRTGSYVRLRYVNASGYERTLIDGTVEQGGKASPCTFAGSFKRQLRQWSAQGCTISALLQDANNHDNREIDYIAARNGVLSYLPKGKTHTTNPDGTWSRQGRQEGKPGRVIQKILTPEARAQINDAELATFGDHTRAAGLLESGTIQLVSGPDIADWYHEDTYADKVDEYGNGTSLAKSCMRSVDSSYFDIYTQHPEQCRMAILTNDDDMLIGRALVWETDQGFTFMDRIYGDEDVQEAFKAYARTQQWHHRTRQTYDNKTSITTPGGYTDSIELTVTLENMQTGWHFPYVDTFTYYCPNSNQLTNDEDNEDAEYSLHSLAGGKYDHRNRNRRVSCYYCNERLDPNDCYRDNDGDALCEDCYGQHYTSCARCGDSIVIDSNDECTSPNEEPYCAHCFNLNCFNCADCGEPEWDTEGGTNTSEDHVCRNCADNYVYCNDCDTTVHIDDYASDRCNECQQAIDDAEATEADEPAPVVTTEDASAEAIADAFISYNYGIGPFPERMTASTSSNTTTYTVRVQ